MAYSRTLNHFTSMQELATIWASSTSYVVNQLVINNNKLYRCLVAHTSGGTFIADLQAAYWVEISASAASGINYVTNPNAEVDTSGWVTYAESDAVTFQDAGDTVTLSSHGLSNGTAISFTSITSTTGISINTLYYVVNAATNTFQVATSVGGSALALTTNGSGTLVRSIPKLGTGGSPAVTFTRNTSSPLRGDADFRLAKGAANRMGQGVSYDFTVDDADLAKVLTLSFDYELVTATGTYANADLVIYLIQDPTGTPVVIQPAGYTVLSAASMLPQRQIATFQTSSSVKSYRLCVHVASVSATAYTLAVDNVQVGPQVVQYGAPVTDWQAYTPTFTGFGTVSAISMYYRRVGDSVEIKGKFTSGTSTATEGRVSVPAGLTTDSAKIATIEVVGFSERAAVGGVAQDVGFSYAVLSEQSVGYVTFSSRSSGTTGLTKLNGNSIASSGNVMSLYAKVPILGWSSAVQMSNDTDTRVVAEIYKGNAGTSVTLGVTNVPYTTKDQSTHNAWNGTQFIAPIPGFYLIECGIRTTANFTAGPSIYVDGVEVAFLGITTTASYFVGNRMVYLNAGQAASIRFSSNATLLNDPIGHYISIHRVSGPSAIAASETVAARYSTGAGQSIASTSFVIVNFATKVFDTHGAVTTGASWKFTAPVSGIYSVSSSIVFNTSGGTNTLKDLRLVKNNTTDYADVGYLRTAGGFSDGINGSTLVALLAGESIDIRGYQNSGATLTLTTDALNNHISIVRVGNYA